MASVSLHSPVVSPLLSARGAGLKYVSDQTPGIHRVKRGAAFAYIAPDDSEVRDPEVLARIHALVIPPAWTEVWICACPAGHIQAIGRDARGRKQYRYHAEWRRTRDETKYSRLLEFAQALPRIRQRIARDLGRRGLPREKVLATVVRLLETTKIRIGNEEYARTNGSYGLSTLRDEHVEISGARIRFHFRGKSGVEHQIDVSDRRLARIVRQCQELPGQELFQYCDADGSQQSISSTDVNAYLREISGQDITAKEFRTWSGTVLAFRYLREIGAADCPTRTKRNIVAAIRRVSAVLGNTLAVCRKCYVHPTVIEAYTSGELFIEQKTTVRIRLASSFDEHERAVLHLLHRSQTKPRRVRGEGESPARSRQTALAGRAS
jgi:DNA topoisomerase-1